MAKPKDKTEWKDERIQYLILSIVGLIITTVFYLIPKDFRKIDKATLASIDKLILEKDPEIETLKGKEKILLFAKGYNKPFQIAGFDFNLTSKRNILNDLKQGDTINVMTDRVNLNP